MLGTARAPSLAPTACRNGRLCLWGPPPMGRGLSWTCPHCSPVPCVRVPLVVGDHVSVCLVAPHFPTDDPFRRCLLLQAGVSEGVGVLFINQGRHVPAGTGCHSARTRSTCSPCPHSQIRTRFLGGQRCRQALLLHGISARPLSRAGATRCRQDPGTCISLLCQQVPPSSR